MLTVRQGQDLPTVSHRRYRAVPRPCSRLGPLPLLSACRPSHHGILTALQNSRLVLYTLRLIADWLTPGQSKHENILSASCPQLHKRHAWPPSTKPWIPGSIECITPLTLFIKPSQNHRTGTGLSFRTLLSVCKCGLVAPPPLWSITKPRTDISMALSLMVIC